MITPPVINKRIIRLAEQIAKDYSNSEIITIIIVLTGAFMFAGDLCREIFRQTQKEIQIYPIKITTYGNEIKSDEVEKRKVSIDLDLVGNFENCTPLIVDDILDQGFTLTKLKEHLMDQKKVKNVRICVLLEKKLKDHPSHAEDLRRSLNVSYKGFTIPDIWVAGYGIDAKQDFRHLPFIISVNEEYYLKNQSK